MTSDITVIKSSDITKLIKRIDQLEKHLSTIANGSLKKLYSEKDFVSLLQISKKTAQNYRDRGLVTFIKVGSRIYYRDEDIEDLFQSHLYQKFKKN